MAKMKIKKSEQIKELEKKLNWYEKKHGPYIEKTGLHNWKNLFRMPTLSEWTVFFCILMALFMGYAYKIDTDTCYAVVNNLSVYACQICSESMNLIPQDIDTSNLTFNFTLTGERWSTPSLINMTIIGGANASNQT